MAVIHTQEIPEGELIVYDSGDYIITENPGSFAEVSTIYPMGYGPEHIQLLVDRIVRRYQQREEMRYARGLSSRSLDERLLLGQDPGILGRRSIDANDPEDLAWLRLQIERGNITRESRPIQVRPLDQFVMIMEHEGWVYYIGRRTGITVAEPVLGHLGTAPFTSQDTYLWGVRGSSTARIVWRRDHLRARGLPIVNREAMDRMADAGVSPETDFVRGSLQELRQFLSDPQRNERLQRFVDEAVARYNNEPYGLVVGIIAGILEFGTRLVLDIATFPLAIAELFSEAGNIIQQIKQSIPSILEGLENAPIQTIGIIISVVKDAFIEVTGLGDIADDLRLATRAREEERWADYGRHMANATLRVIELVLVIRALANALLRIPRLVARIRRSITRLNQSAARLSAARETLREGRQLVDTAEDASLTGPRHVHSGARPGERLAGRAFESEVDDAIAQVDAVFDDIARGAAPRVRPVPLDSIPFPGRARFRQIFENARRAFNRIRGDYARRLGIILGDGGQVHHAIELDVLQRYPGTFSEAELNAFRNMRGIPPERTLSGVMHPRRGRKQLHNAAIRRAWNRHYRRLNEIIRARHANPSDAFQIGNQIYRRFVRRYVMSARDEIDHLVGQHFSEVRNAMTWIQE